MGWIQLWAALTAPEGSKTTAGPGGMPPPRHGRPPRPPRALSVPLRAISTTKKVDFSYTKNRFLEFGRQRCVVEGCGNLAVIATSRGKRYQRLKCDGHKRTGLGPRVRNVRWKERKAEKTRIRIAANKAIIDEIKRGGCKDCGKRFPPVCMDFDHVRGEKKFAISDKMHMAFGKLEVEIAKCDLVCVCCHRIRHWFRKSLLG